MPHRGAVNRGPASLQGWVIVVASFHKLQLIVVPACVANQYIAHACALAMAYGCLVWVGGPRAGVVAQPRCLAGHTPIKQIVPDMP